MNELELFKAEAIKSVANSSDYRILAIDGKAVLAEKFSSQPQQVSASGQSTDKTLMIGAIALFGLGVVAGCHFQAGFSAQKIQNLTAENIVLESKISKIKDLLK